jgi:hypothetical protein
MAGSYVFLDAEFRETKHAALHHSEWKAPMPGAEPVAPHDDRGTPVDATTLS